ncbi:dihydropteroate synthase [Legionella sp.]|uniref:dihydropteroate synthase n=1 Tax=Legionella sp. TaxID=459 RepID=UPI003C84D8EC
MNSIQFKSWLTQRGQLSLNCHFEKPLIMGILNVTPDSFSDGGKFFAMERACEHGFHLITQGADLIDVGGQSSKPGAKAVPTEVELDRVIPVIKHLRANSDICISIDTDKPEVMEAAVDAGANVINDINALEKQGALAMAAKLAVPVCLMHMQGEPQTMQQNPHYSEGVLNEVMKFFVTRIETCLHAGIDKKNLILDPGFGFGKRVEDNLCLVNKLDFFSTLKLPLLLGVSRKSTIGAVLNKEVNDRLIGGIALAVYAALKGVGIIRTHDVDETNQALTLIERVCQARLC